MPTPPAEKYAALVAFGNLMPRDKPRFGDMTPVAEQIDFGLEVVDFLR